MIAELHTTDLSASCPKSVQLRHEGKIVGEMPGALYKGNLWHEAAPLLHTMPGTTLGDAIENAHKIVSAKAQAENRPLTKAVLDKLPGLKAEVMEWLATYQRRVLPLFANRKLIGVEVPVRMTLDVDGTPQEFASHIDILYREPSGMLCFDDWKTGEDGPTSAYLSRNIQVGVYYLCLLNGSALVNDDWIDFNETALPRWVHIPALLPYGRKTTVGDKVFERGDDRPIDRVIHEVEVTNMQAIIEQLTTRVRMFRAGLYPTNPEPTACYLCESRGWCPSWNGEPRASE